MASPGAEKFAELLRSAPPMAELPLAEQRAAGEHAEDMRPACGYWRWTTRSPRSTRSPPT